MLGLSSIWFSYFFDRRSFILFYGIGRELDLVRKGRKACHDNFMSIIGYMSTCSSSTNYLFSFFFNNYLHNMVVFQIQYLSISYLRATRNNRNAYFLSIFSQRREKYRPWAMSSNIVMFSNSLLLLYTILTSFFMYQLFYKITLWFVLAQFESFKGIIAVLEFIQMI